MSEESTRGFSISIYVTDKKAFEECKRLLKLQGRSLSEEIMNFVLKKLGELKGTGESGQDKKGRLQQLKEEYDDLVVKTVKLERQLKTSNDFEEATALLLELGMKKVLSNVDEVIPKFVSAWKGDESFMHQVLNLAELARDKNRALQALTIMRSAEPVKPEPSQVRDTVPVKDEHS